MNMRKPKVLELAVNCFNSVQDKAALRLQSMQVPLQNSDMAEVYHEKLIADEP